MIYLLPHTIDESAQRAPDHEAFRCRDTSISYGDLAERANQLAHLLLDLGVKPGERVGVRLPKCIESPLAVHGIMKSGAAFVPIDPFLPNSGLARVISECGIRHLITDRVPGALDDAPLEAVIGPEDDPAQPIRGVPWATLAEYPSDRPPDVRATEHDLAYIMCTSGSTGRPKGIMHTHRSGLSYARLSVCTYGVRPDDRIGNHSPLHFVMSTFGYFAGPLAGATTVLIPEEHTKLPASLSQLMEQERISIWYSVPSSLIQLLDRGVLARRDLSSLRWVKFGGEPFAAKHLRALMKRWPHARFSNVYGPAEVNQCTRYHVPPIGGHDGSGRENDDPTPIGKVWENTQGLVMDEDDQPVGTGQVGELLIRSATMMLGYWNQPELTARSLYRLRKNGVEKVFYRTGDLVRLLDDGGYVFIGRRDRQIKTRGHRVELDDVEAALACREGVLESAAYAVDDGEGSRVIEAAVVLVHDCELSEPGVLAHARKLLPAYAVPRRIQIRREFPRTPTGKIDRVKLEREASLPAPDPT